MKGEDKENQIFTIVVATKECSLYIVGEPHSIVISPNQTECILYSIDLTQSFVLSTTLN